MGSWAGRMVRVGAVWVALGVLVVTTVAYMSSRSEPRDRVPVWLGEIELLATATFFDEGPIYSGQNNLLRGNFVGSLGSSDSECIANREITFFREMPGSAPDAIVAVSISDNAGTTGNFTSSEWHDPPGVDTYYAVVAPDEAKDCAGVTSDPIVVN